VKAIVMDAKGDTPWMLRHEGVLSLNDLAFSLVAYPSYGTPTAFINRWLTLFRECFWTAELQSAVLLPILREVIQPGRPASVEDIVQRIRLRDRSPAGKAAADRLESTSLVYPNLYASRTNRWDALHETSLYCAIEGTLTPAARFVLWLVIIERFAYLQHQQHRDRVHTVVFLDEAQTSLSKRQQTISGLPSTPVQLLPMTREHGMQFVVATPLWTELDPLVLSQFQVQIALQPSDGRELDAIAKSFRLTPAQSRFTPGMQRGTAVGKIRGIEHPFLFTYQPFNEPKDIDEHTRAAARARAERFNATSNTLAAREENESTGQPAPPPTPAAAPSASHALAAPLLNPETAHNTREPIPPSNKPSRVALNKHAAAILADVGDNPLTLTTPCFHGCNLRLSEGERAKATVTNLGFLESFKVRTGAGRGKTGSAMRLTPAGWAWLGRKPPKGTRGGDSVQHEFLVRQLARLIARSTIEMLGADLVIPYNAEEHEHVHLALEMLSATTIALNTGDLIALEVECSRPDITAARNVTRDAGFALTVIATLQQDLASLQRRMAHNDRVAIVDVLRLLDALRTTEGR